MSADLGFNNAASVRPSCAPAYALNQVLEARKRSQADAAKVVTQPRYLRFVTTSWRTFSVERLVNLLTAHGQDVEIVIQRKPSSRKAVGSASSRLKRRRR